MWKVKGAVRFFLSVLATAFVQAGVFIYAQKILSGSFFADSLRIVLCTKRSYLAELHAPNLFPCTIRLDGVLCRVLHQ